MLKPAENHFQITVRQLAVPDYLKNRHSTHWRVELTPDHGGWSRTVYWGPCPKVAAKAAIMVANLVSKKGYAFSIDAGADNDNGRAAPDPRPAA